MKISHRCVWAGVVVVTLAGASEARASAIPEAGGSTIGLAAGVAHANVDANDTTLRVTQVTAAPTFDAVVAGGLTVGAALPFSWSRMAFEGSPTQTSYTVRPMLRVGYLVPLGAHAAFWPVATFGHGSAHTGSGRVEWDTKSWEAGLAFQVVIPLDERFYVRVTPLDARWSDQSMGSPTGGYGVVGASVGSAIAVGAWL